ncbi:MAG: YtxH domain-containing protein [Candidatus Promineifilaceae bacterium]
MNNSNDEYEYDVNQSSGFLAGLVFLAGLLFGGLIGAGTMLLLAPQSGKKTRLQIQRKGRDLRVQTADAVDSGVAQVRTKARDISTSIHDHAEDLQQGGQDAVDQQKERWGPVVEAGITAVHG